MAWRWTAWRLAISGFVVFHLLGTLVWILPDSPLRKAVSPIYRPYMLPLGLWQSWWMFAPDPMTETALLEAEVIDAHGIRHLYEFPRIADLPWWKKLPRFRHPKFTCNLFVEEYGKLRKSAAGFAVHQLHLKPEQFPAHASLYCQVKDSPPPGRPYSDPLSPTRLSPLGTFEFASIEEVRR
jgi:hypothetical protein